MTGDSKAVRPEPAAEPLQALRREILADTVYEQLKNLIIRRQVAPGQRLNIEDLARRLGVSPTPVRESLARLEAEELTVKLALKGYSTTDLLDAKQVTDLYALRTMIEVPSAGIAANKISDEQAEQLRAELASAGESVPPDDLKYFEDDVDHDDRFHTLILDIAGNETVSRAFARTHCHLHLFRLAYDDTFGNSLRVEHAAITKALIARDSKAAESAMELHLELARDRMLAGFDR